MWQLKNSMSKHTVPFWGSINAYVQKSTTRVFSTLFLTQFLPCYSSAAGGIKMMMVPDHNAKSVSLLCHFQSSWKPTDLSKRVERIFNIFKYKCPSTWLTFPTKLLTFINASKQWLIAYKFIWFVWIPVPLPVMGNYNELKLSFLLNRDRLKDENCCPTTSFFMIGQTCFPSLSFHFMITGYSQLVFY